MSRFYSSTYISLNPFELKRQKRQRKDIRKRQSEVRAEEKEIRRQDSLNHVETNFIISQRQGFNPSHVASQKRTRAEKRLMNLDSIPIRGTFSVQKLST